MSITAADMDFTVFCIFDHPPDRVFEAIADPNQLSQHFTTAGASGRMERGATVTWEFADFPGPFDVSVTESLPGERLVFNWPNNSGTGSNRVTFSFSQIEPGRTRVEVTETGWDASPEGLKAAYGNVMGWSYMLATMRTWLDHGLSVRQGMFR